MTRIPIAFIIGLCLNLNILFAQEASETVSSTCNFKIETSEAMTQKLEYLENQHQDSVARKMEAFRKNLPAKDMVSDNIQFTVNSAVVTEKTEAGADETNLKLNFEYKVIAPNVSKFRFDKVTDDFPAGAYLPSASNSCRLICNIIKKTIDEDYPKYFTDETRITIKIWGITDASPIGGRLPYRGEFGEFENHLIFFNNEYTDLTVTKASGITSNVQLGFLRTQGIQKFLTSYVDKLQITQNNYQIYAEERPERGMQYRKIAVEFTIHDAFNEVMSQMKDAKSTDKSAVSSIDTGLVQTSAINPNCYALIIANEQYRNPVPAAVFAHRDGESFQQYCVKVLGIPEKYVFVIKDASKNMIDDKIDMITNLIKLKEGDSQLLVYYAGHGTRDADGLPYLVPADANPAKSGQLYAVSDFCKMLEMSHATTIIGFMDACFNGYKRNGEPLCAGSVVTSVKPKSVAVPDNMIVYFGGSSDGIAYNNVGEQHGNFTFCLLKLLKENGGSLNCGDLLNGIKEEMILQTGAGGHTQMPSVEFGKTMKNKWESLNLLNPKK